MTTKADFTDDEWATVIRSPIVAGMAITLADPGGPIEVVKETSAVLKFVTGEGEQRDDLVGEVAREIRSLAQQRTNPVGDFKPRGALAGKQGLDRRLHHPAGAAPRGSEIHQHQLARAFHLRREIRVRYRLRVARRRLLHDRSMCVAPVDSGA